MYSDGLLKLPIFTIQKNFKILLTVYSLSPLFLKIMIARNKHITTYKDGNTVFHAGFRGYQSPAQKDRDPPHSGVPDLLKSRQIPHSIRREAAVRRSGLTVSF